MWVDDNDFVRQELLPDGRYDEARGMTLVRRTPRTV
jgi:Agrobacterium tumefaciens protein Atu4866